MFLIIARQVVKLTAKCKGAVSKYGGDRGGG